MHEEHRETGHKDEDDTGHHSIKMRRIKQAILRPTLVFWGMLMFAGMITGCADYKKSSALQPARLYVANEEGGSVSVVDLRNNSKNILIDLTDSQSEMYMAHNVQVAPDGKSVWVTAVPMDSKKTEQLVVIDPKTGTIKNRIELGKHLHVAHVVLDNESKNAFVTAKDSNQVFQVNAAAYKVVRRFDLGTDNAPHGMRYFNGKLYVANMGSKSLSIVNVADGQIRDIPLQGMAAQTAVTQDGKFVFASLYDTKEVARYDLQHGQITKIPLPEGSQGPIQLYATPDSKLLYVCDQGELLQRPVSDKVYVIDISKAKVISAIKVGNKAHGVVVSRDGKTAYVTNTSDNTISIIDVITQKVTDTVTVGKGPNGISYWFETGGMP